MDLGTRRLVDYTVIFILSLAVVTFLLPTLGIVKIASHMSTGLFVLFFLSLNLSSLSLLLYDREKLLLYLGLGILITSLILGLAPGVEKLTFLEFNLAGVRVALGLPMILEVIGEFITCYALALISLRLALVTALLSFSLAVILDPLFYGYELTTETLIGSFFGNLLPLSSMLLGIVTAVIQQRS